MTAPDWLSAHWSDLRHKGRDYSLVLVRVGDRSVQISRSASGRSVRVWVDGVEVKA